MSSKGLERAAILLLGIGEENAAEVLRHMESAEVQRLGAVMNRMTGITRAQIQNAIQSFASDVEQQTSFGIGAQHYVRNMLENALGKDKATGLFNRIQLGIDTDGLVALSQMQGRKIADFIRKEHLQVKAMILSYLDEEKSSEVLRHYSEEENVDLLYRIGTLESVQPEVLQHLNDVMEQHIASKKNEKSSATLGGVKVVANMLNYFDSDREEDILSGLSERDEDLSLEVKELMFVFDHLIHAEDKSMQALLRNVPSESLILAMRGADDAIREKVFSNMSKRAADLMRDDMEAMGPVRLSDVEEAQKEVMVVATRMREAGEFRINRGADQVV